MNSLLERLQEFKNWKQILRNSCKDNQVSTSLAGQLTILKTRSLYTRFQKTYEREDDKLKYCWGQNELKAFHWVAICLSAIEKTKIIEFDQNQWEQISDIFKFKERSVLQYEAAKLLHTKIKKSEHWVEEEQKLLQKIIGQSQQQNIKWNQVGRNLFWHSNKIYFRSGKQCRERWMNHLDPKKKHGNWSIEQDLKLLELADTENRKWAKIVTFFDGERTQHMVKNRFKSLISKQKKIDPTLRKESKILEALKQRLSNCNTCKTSKQQQQDSSFIQNKPAQLQKGQAPEMQVLQKSEVPQVIAPNYAQNKIEIDKMNAQHQEEKHSQQKQDKGNQSEHIDPNIEGYFEEISDDKNQQFGGFKMYSPYCVAYSMGNNIGPGLTPTGLTPTGLTPSYFSPPAFFMNSFTQNMLSFQKCLNSEGGNNQTNSNSKQE